ncbi:hypothetical protein [Aureibacter tunicatorum]|uniref:Uncharacterized protein n=1 Tax=Aureibacter tunicatorum TaxID=866807 RepID=A0AAE4BSZ3_9BACT|nr:hypothetical protein [Aureibacter tunicatorum]MDR6239323.1 hypothetical protein [Aureibacter tunicatorum]BDD04754.1 hypothetical protein AUTU_22370 [Aureibacter tunicatorum]
MKVIFRPNLGTTILQKLAVITAIIIPFSIIFNLDARFSTDLVWIISGFIIISPLLILIPLYERILFSKQYDISFNDEEIIIKRKGIVDKFLKLDKINNIHIFQKYKTINMKIFLVDDKEINIIFIEKWYYNKNPYHKCFCHNYEKLFKNLDSFDNVKKLIQFVDG